MEFILDLTKRYSFADYLTWFDDVRRELIDGFVKMLPSPLPLHAEVSYNISWHLGAIIKKRKCKCKIYPAPFDVRLPKNGETADDQIHTVVQPDISVVCDPSKIDKRGCYGPPDMIVEVLSPTSLKRDVIEKFGLYEKVGVKEYWIVHTKDETITVFLLQDDGKYNNGTVYEEDAHVPVHIFDDCLIDLKDIFVK
jgi:Uma2 family endonuclease